MKTFNIIVILLWGLLLVGIYNSVQAQAVPWNYSPASKGIYRIPFADGTLVNMNQDHITHRPQLNRMDLAPVNPSSPLIVAAADGWIMGFRDTSTTIQCGSGTAGGCRNNYLWLMHPNGEWSKYTHMQTGSVAIQNHQVGDWVCSGQTLGRMGNVGFSTGPHLHFEVAVPMDTSDPFNGGGWLYQDPGRVTTIVGSDTFLVDPQNRVPIFCWGNTSGDWKRNQEKTAGPCNVGACPNNNTRPPTVQNTSVQSHRADKFLKNANTYIINPGASAHFRAGQKITLRPGMRVREGGYLIAQIAPCGPTPVCTTGTFNKRQEMEPVQQDQNLSQTSLASESVLLVFPNPANSDVTFRLTSAEETRYSLKLYNLMGIMVSLIWENELLPVGEHNHQLNLEGLSSGVYFFRLDDGKEIKTEKLIIRH